MDNWRSKYANGRKGICDFGLNYDFYFKWLTNKVISCLVIRGAPDSINDTYLKTHLILDGNIVVTDFGDDIYGCIGNLGGEPDEYYIPHSFIIANPILGSKTVYWRDFKDHKQNGVLISNTAIDSLGCGLFGGGLYDLIHQTATLLADNIISINCAQINGRVTAFFTADSEAQAVAGENILKTMYAGAPYKVIRQDLVEKININPIAQTGHAQTITQLVELHNYIIANFFQSIGIRSNNVMKKERLITDEIESQDDFVQLSILEILSSWQKGFDEVNRLYGTDIYVELNPVLIREIADEFSGESDSTAIEQSNEAVDSIPADTNEATESDTERSEQSESMVEETEEESPTDVIEEAEEVVEEIVDIINDTVEETEEVAEDERTES